MLRQTGWESKDWQPINGFYSTEGHGEFMQYVSSSRIPGFENNLGTLSEWVPLLRRAKAKANASHWRAEGGMYMDLGEFAALNLSKL
jgi:hypothetical protein